MKKIITLSIVLVSIFSMFALPFQAEARGRTGSFRVGGYTSHGKGSHYVGGYVRTGPAIRSRSHR